LAGIAHFPAIGVSASAVDLLVGGLVGCGGAIPSLSLPGDTFRWCLPCAASTLVGCLVPSATGDSAGCAQVQSASVLSQRYFRGWRSVHFTGSWPHPFASG